MSDYDSDDEIFSQEELYIDGNHDFWDFYELIKEYCYDTTYKGILYNCLYDHFYEFMMFFIEPSGIPWVRTRVYLPTERRLCCSERWYNENQKEISFIINSFQNKFKMKFNNRDRINIQNFIYSYSN